jgi:predicted  nucleic acid-binding Zn-ribbon protein
MENEEPKEIQEPKDGVSTPEDLEAIKAQLEEERKAKAAAEASLADKDDRIAALEAELSEARSGFESTTAELSSVKEANAQAVSKYLDAVRLANPAIPQDIIAGETIEEIDASVEKAKAIASAVKANLEAQAKEAKVPAGAPPRGEISLEGLTPREKIAAGLNQKGGTQQ